MPNTPITQLAQQLTPGVITPAAVEAFTRGACASLALALHDTTGWPLVEVGHCDGLPFHFTVRHPDGLLVDILGTRTEEDVAEEYEYDADGDVVTFTETDRALVWRCYLEDCGEPVPMDVARTFVPAVLALVQQ